MGDDGIDVDLGALGARAGYKFTPYLGLEGEALFGVADEDFTFEGVDVSAELNYAVGLYGRVEAPVTDRVTLYGRLGVVNAELEVTASVPGVSISESESETGAGFGAGAEFAVTDTFGIYVDYTRYDIDELEIDGLSVGGKYRF